MFGFSLYNYGLFFLVSKNVKAFHTAWHADFSEWTLSVDAQFLKIAIIK